MDTMDTSPCVLIIEDDPDLRRILELQTRKLGFRPQTAENGRIGFETAREVCPDLILLDLMMPEMNGFQVLKRIKSIDKLAATPVLILTASHSDTHRRKTQTHMADGFMTKPYTVDQLRKEIQRVMPELALN
jgi:DNA-binding response OmpR family regulator